jgi:predicted DNA-binding transcriptional regulator AlpA
MKSSNQSGPLRGYIRQSRLLEFIPLSSATLWRFVNEGKFPRPIKLSERVTVWKVSEVKAWLEEKEMAANKIVLD